MAVQSKRRPEGTGVSSVWQVLLAGVVLGACGSEPSTTERVDTGVAFDRGLDARPADSALDARPVETGVDARSTDTAPSDVTPRDAPLDALDARTPDAPDVRDTGALDTTPRLDVATDDGALDVRADVPPRVDLAPDGPSGDVPVDAPGVDVTSPCGESMALVGTACVDLYEAPNVAGALPLVMYTFVEAEAWCSARGKRLCFDDEWAVACEGPTRWTYPYGNTHRPGVCNDEELWRTYSQTLLNGWPRSASNPSITSLDALWASARVTAPATVTHLQGLYQGEGSGTNTGCTNAFGVFDTLGNVEEWTRRRDGGTTDFHGMLKGRYWGNERPSRDTRCRGGVTTHGDQFRFYEIGFRCCRDSRG